ncbi:MAG TPA: DUF6603 domain-containing protein [Vicinamibacterales bacterium]|nr:DUF6603 domain-containing protein [Vicinamibacterales bacterium]
MPLDPAALPLLLAGPILRRVEADLVSVWIATSRACNAVLLLFDGRDVVASRTEDEDQRAKWVSAPQPTRQIGANLHVLTVVLDLRTPGGNAARSAGATLQANQTFSYDLKLFERADPTRPKNLRALELLEGSAPLGYDPGELPSFRTCPQELDQLVIVHGSCRQMFSVAPLEDDPATDLKPFIPPTFDDRTSPPKRVWPRERPSPESPRHDGEPDEFPSKEFPQLPKRDGMLWIDTLIEHRGPSPMVDRPHQLFLTGDQIYADQVSPELLPVLSNLAHVLVGSEELGADPSGIVFKPATLENFPPGFRADIVRRSAAFTTSSGGGHLLSFGEFVAYYLLAWSPALWDLEEKLWPDSFVPANVPMPEDWRIRFIYKEEPVDIETQSEDNFTDAFKELLEQLPVEDTIRRSPEPPKSLTPPDETELTAIADWYFLQQRDWIESKYWSPDLLEWWTQRFRGGLPRVRRALANVPTYMIADDHDISDDWNFSRQWREQVYTRPLGVDIVRNGLMAITLMQAWGNDPRRWAGGLELELLDRISAYAPAMHAAAGANPPRPFPRATLDRLHELMGLPKSVSSSVAPTFRPLVEYSYQVEGPCHRALVIDGRTKRRFPFRNSQAGGIDYEGATGLVNNALPTGLPGEEATGLFGDSPMAAALPERPAGDTKLTIVVTGVPVIGPEGMELALVPFQRFARLLGEVDAESWAYEPSTYEALLAALARYESVVLLSGDVHIGWSAALDYWSNPGSGQVRTARMVQLVSSGLTKDWGDLAPALRGNALSLDVFESATNSQLMHAERVGWGTPFRITLTPPTPLGPLVTHPERAHPFYRARLKMRAPVVPAHGWPEGTKEAREPNWAWRAAMGRDDRVDSTLPPTMVKRWTPVDLPPNPIDQSTQGWHAKAARRMAFGRVFATYPNVGIVTFEPDGANWSVRHVIAGELLPLADTGVNPTGLQPYLVHRFTLAPVAPSTWNDQRPKIVDDGGWGVDTTDPSLPLLFKALPLIWKGAAEFAGGLFDALPPVMDDVTREALLADAASRVSTPFRRRVLRELGPFATFADINLDRVTDADIAARFPQVGPLEVSKEARALVRPDIERLFAIKQAASPAAVFDDLLLLACSEWVNERARTVSMIAGILVTFRSPVTKHVPVLAGLLGGLWDLWRNRTSAESWPDPTGLVSLPPRIVRFVLRLILEVINNVIQDQEKRPGGGPPIFVPELVVAAIGAWQGISLPKRFNVVSGWEPRATPVAPGTRAKAQTPEAMARQTFTLIVHPGDRQRFTAPARNVSATMIPPPAEPEQDETERIGSLLLGWDGGLQADEEIGAGFLARFELDGRGFHQVRWGGSRKLVIDARGGASFRVTLLRPTLVTLIPGADIRITPAVSLAIGVKSGQAEGDYRPALTFRIALNDQEDRITFLPDDELLVQLLPTEGIALPVDGAFEWTLEHGWRFAGFGEVASTVLIDPGAPLHTPRDPSADDDDPPDPKLLPTTEVVTPINKRLGVLTFHERRLEVTTANDVNGATFNLSVTATVSLNIGPVRIAVSGLGVRGSLHLSSEFESVDDLIDFSIAIPMPTGLAVSVDADVISGGGFLQRIESATGRVTWRGGIALRLGERYDVAAWGVVETGGGRHWTLLALLVVRFSPPIHLTAGLKLVALGGLLALNRTMDVNALRDAATGTQGTLEPVLLPDRPEQRFLELLPAIERFFPAAKGSQVVGLLAEIEWRAETGTKFGSFRLALLGELEKLQFGLYGTAQLGFPTIDEAHILRVRAAAEALYDHRAGFFRASFTLIEALLFDRVHLTGGAAMLIRWGGRNEFAVTLGGFHPSFRPFIPEGLREPPRLGAYWKPHSLVELSIKAYFALTSTSLQFGFAAHVEAGASWGGFRADAEFNFLVMTDPVTRFELDLSFRVTVSLFGADLISASLSGSLTGPRPWVIEGSVYWEVCGVSISKDFGPYDWGDKPAQVGTTQQEARKVIGDGLSDAANWTRRRNSRMPVRLRSGSDDALDPRDQIDIRQTRLPLGIDLEVHDANSLADRGAWTLRPATQGLTKVSDLTDVFPTRRYLRKPPKETPFRGGLTSGVRVGGAGWTFTPALAIESDEGTTEDLVLDSLPTPPKRVKSDVRVPLRDAVIHSAPTRARERKWNRHTIELEAV